MCSSTFSDRVYDEGRWPEVFQIENWIHAAIRADWHEMVGLPYEKHRKIPWGSTHLSLLDYRVSDRRLSRSVRRQPPESELLAVTKRQSTSSGSRLAQRIRAHRPARSRRVSVPGRCNGLCAKSRRSARGLRARTAGPLAFARRIPGGSGVAHRVAARSSGTQSSRCVVQHLHSRRVLLVIAQPDHHREVRPAVFGAEGAGHEDDSVDELARVPGGIAS